MRRLSHPHHHLLQPDLFRPDTPKLEWRQLPTEARGKATRLMARLGAKMALRGLAASQPRMRADTHDGPEQIAPLQRPDTLMQLSRSLISEVHLVPHGRAIHFGTKRTSRDFSCLSAFGGKADIAPKSLSENIRRDYKVFGA